MSVHAGKLIVINNKVWEVMKIDFNCIVYCKEFYNEGTINIEEFEICTVENAIREMKERGARVEI